jgi:hypothetical protein
VREEFAKLDLRLNEAKSRIVDLSQGESFGFLGFDFRRVRSHLLADHVEKRPRLRRQGRKTRPRAR